MNATQFAHLYDEHFARIWRDGSGNPVLEQGWLEQWWVADAAVEPGGPPVATSVLAAGGAGIRWRENADELVGHVSTRPGGCFHVPRAAADALNESPAA